MGLFSKKIKFTIQEVTQTNLEVILELYKQRGAVSDFRNSLIQSDIIFSSVSNDIFNKELSALQLEIFSLAWIHYYKIESAIKQSIYTKEYLITEDCFELWNGMEKYNKAVVRAVNFKLDEQSLINIVEKKKNLADYYIDDLRKKGIEPDETYGRPINRAFSRKAWEDGFTQVFLMFAFFNALGFDEQYNPSEEISNSILLIIKESYELFFNSIKLYKIN